MHLDGVDTAESNGMGCRCWIGRMSVVGGWEVRMGLYWCCGVMKCAFHGWGRVLWEKGWEWVYSLLDCDIWCEHDAIATGIELPRLWVYLGGNGTWMWLMGWEWRDRPFCGRIGASVVVFSYSDFVLIGMGMRCGWFGMRNGVDFKRFGGNDHYFEFPPFWLDFHHFRCGSS